MQLNYHIDLQSGNIYFPKEGQTVWLSPQNTYFKHVSVYDLSDRLL
jgi:hypothetical protein